MPSSATSAGKIFPDERPKTKRIFEGDWVELAPHVKEHGCLKHGVRGKVIKDTYFENPNSTLCYQVQAPEGRPSWYSTQDLRQVQWPPPPPGAMQAEVEEPQEQVREEVVEEKKAVVKQYDDDDDGVQYTLETSETVLKVEVVIPVVKAVSELSVDLADHEITIAPADSPGPFSLIRIPLRVPVDSDAASAKWEKKKRILRVTLPRRPGHSPAPTPPPAPTEPSAPTAAATAPPAPVPAPVSAPAAPSPAAPSPAAVPPPAEAEATGAGEEGESSFQSCESWQGPKEGWYFGRESEGLGYYKDWRLIQLCGGFELGQRIYAARDIVVGGDIAVREGDVGHIRGPGKRQGRIKVVWMERRDMSWQQSLSFQQPALDCAVDAIAGRFLAPGARVRVEGLLEKAEYNGCVGTVCKRSGDRWGIRFDDPSLGEKALLRAKLVILRGAEDARD